MQNFETSFEKLVEAVNSAVDQVGGLKRKNKELIGEVNELKRLLALSEKKSGEDEAGA